LLKELAGDVLSFGTEIPATAKQVAHRREILGEMPEVLDEEGKLAHWLSAADIGSGHNCSVAHTRYLYTE